MTDRQADAIGLLFLSLAGAGFGLLVIEWLTGAA
jgi:hypothetical protein